mmetsp:Transcript_58923/g.68137  ORF Transcript_58923/g.68137 Transcript_58923/m.68137 type:complete len:271 (-) Transcript_58923:474-1286(-)
MALENVEDSIKVIVVGDGNVGKTSMLRRFVRGEFVDQYKKTIGAEFLEKEVFVRDLNQSVTLMLWDTAGQEVFNALTASYYRGAGVAILSFSTIDRDSFMSVEKWKQKVEAQCGRITMVLCQTKYDLMNEAAVSNQEAEALAVKLKLPFFRISTKDNFNVNQLFEFTARLCLSSGMGMDGGVETLQAHATPVSAASASDEHGSAPNTGAAASSAAAPSNGPTAAPSASSNNTSNVASTKDDDASGNSKPINMKDPPAKKPKKKRSVCAML